MVRRTAWWRPGRGTVAHHSPVRTIRLSAGLGALSVVAASCGGPGHVHAAAPHSAPAQATAPTVGTAPTTVVAPATTAPAPVVITHPPAVPTPAPVRPVAPATAPATTTPVHQAPVPPASLLVTRLVGVGSASQLVAVQASGYGQNVATVTAFERGPGGWRQELGPWQAYIGHRGFAPPGQKREGDGRTPSGSFGFGFFFGVLADPGVAFPYRRVTGPDIVWDDDPASPRYNQWVDTTAANPGSAPEPMDRSPVYDYGAVIAYNSAPTVPGAGSAIFLHASGGDATTGCVSLPSAELLTVLRWLSPAAQPRIIMGTTSTISP
jgi:L,D-peptidoglycan transpeptidase YkuD (ErfK/YbiS/YcfS/YnhG family)